MASGDMSRDESNIPHSAKYTAATWQWGGLPCAAVTLPEGAEKLFSLVNRYMRFYRFINPKKYSLHHTLLHRHTIINTLMEKANCPQIIEVAAGFSPRGAKTSEAADIQYFEVDLPDVVELKKNQLLKSEEGTLVLKRTNFTQMAASILDLDFSQAFPKVKSFIITEGLMMYFSRKEQMDVWRNIAAQVKATGGQYCFDYIPLDVEPERSWIGKIFHGIKSLFGGDGQGYCYDERTRWDVREDLLEAGFSDVILIDSSEIAEQWSLPFKEINTRVIVYHCF